MDVLIIERDEQMGLVLADTLDGEGISFAVTSDEEALKLPPDDAPRMVVTGLNRSHYEDQRGLDMVSAMRRKWPHLCALYLAALGRRICAVGSWRLASGSSRSRFTSRR
jgi:DNA-binding NtrC family response regulator